jgi:hypothetical protein
VLHLFMKRRQETTRVAATKRRGDGARQLPETGILLRRCRPRLRLIGDSNRPSEAQLPDVRIS